jgi:hypothetical protein
LFKANSSKLFKEINVGYITKGTYRPDKIQAQRAVIIPANINKNNAAVLDAVFLSKVRLSQRVNKYKVLPRFFDNINLLGASAKVRGAAVIARKALLKVTRSGDYKLTTSIPLKGVQYTL